jgi:phenylacetate-CoA ligase
MNAARLPGIAAHFVRAHWRWAMLRGPALARFQERRARRIVAYAGQHSPFYRAHWAGYQRDDWRRLPTVDKRLMMEQFDTFNTLGIRREAALAVALRAERERDFRPTLNGVTVGLSSGTSGHRGLFLASPWEQVAWAGTILARALHRVRPGCRVAFFLRANSNLYQQTSGTLIDLRYFDLMLPLAEAVPALNAYRPHLVVGPPSLLGLLADARRAGRLVISRRG